jgi:hypothetical protein
VRLTLGLAGVLLVFASSRANAEEACAPNPPPAPLLTNAIGVCDEPGFDQPTPAPQKEKLPVECDGATCQPQPAPIDATGTTFISFQNPLAVLGSTLTDPEPSTFLAGEDSGGPRAGFSLRIERPPRSW